jgi:pimeloyl-ACP methyl ester carboxylesterase
MARDLKNLLEHYHLDKAALVGHSMGALTIWEYIRTFGTGRVAKLCLIDQSPKLVTDITWAGGIYGDFDRGRSAHVLADLRNDFAETVLRLAAFGNNAAARRGYEEDSVGWRLAREALRRLDPAPLIATWQSLVEADYRDVLPAIDVPTLLVFGSESNFYRPATAHYVRDHVRGAVLQLYEGADHSPHAFDRPRFARELLAFLAA